LAWDPAGVHERRSLLQLRDERAPHSVWSAALQALLPLSAGGGGGGRDGCVSEARLADALAARVLLLERQPTDEAHGEVRRRRRRRSASAQKLRSPVQPAAAWHGAARTRT
jgi:hypothetical protein